MKLIFTLTCIVALGLFSNAQTLGGGTDFATAQTFDQSWLVGCPGGGSNFSNQPAFEPALAMDACAPLPGCATGTTASDVWFKFVAIAPTATIVVAPSSSFDVAIQSFSGTACNNLVQNGCVDLNGNNASETLMLSGLTTNTVYYFRVFGATNNLANRTGTYSFCGSVGLGSTVLPVDITDFSGTALENNNTSLNWTTATDSKNAFFEIEKSANGSAFEKIGSVYGHSNGAQNKTYQFIDRAAIATLNYYRLKQVDVNGQIKYSSIIIVKSNTVFGNTLVISPSLVSDHINIKIHAATATNAAIKIIDGSGRVLYYLNQRLDKGVNAFSLTSLQQLSKGMYILQLFIDDKWTSDRFIKL